jgi:hypothetical protein
MIAIDGHYNAIEQPKRNSNMDWATGSTTVSFLSQNH